jgi:hypothetical protein
MLPGCCAGVLIRLTAGVLARMLPVVGRRRSSLRQMNAALYSVGWGFGQRVLRARGGKRHRCAKQQ